MVMKWHILRYTGAILSIPLLIKLYHEQAGNWTIILAGLIVTGLLIQIFKKLNFPKIFRRVNGWEWD